jgi:hypothetical protein
MLKPSLFLLGCALIADNPGDVPDFGDAADMAPPPRPDSSHLGPSELPEVFLRYDISAKLLAEERKVVGEEVVRWTNPTGQTIDRVPLHLYLNAFSSTATTWTRGSTALRDFDFGRYVDAYGDPWGYIDVDEVAQDTRGLGGDEEAAKAELGYIQPNDGNPFDRTLAEVTLPTPVPAGGELVLRLRFTARMPVTIARTGCAEGWCHVAQWFPKIGVWDDAAKRGRLSGGWAARQFHGPTEFYADYADWDVKLDVPEGWKVVATGRYVGDAGGADGTTKVKAEEAGFDRFHYRQRAVHDFAWVAMREALVVTHRHDPEGPGGPIDISYVAPLGRESDIAELRAVAEKTFDVMGTRVGPYPYDTMKVLVPPWRAQESMGMEYPTLVTAGPGDPLLDRFGLERMHLQYGVTAHELIHNYFYGLVGNDEQQEALLDEGFTTFWEQQVMAAIDEERGPYRDFAGLPVSGMDLSRGRLKGRGAKVREAAVRRPANLFYEGTTGMNVYARVGITMGTAQRRFGADAVDAVMSTYFARWRFAHPTVEDFFSVLDEKGPPEMAAFVKEALRAREIPDFAVDEVASERWEAPSGWLATASGRTELDHTRMEEAQMLPLALPKSAKEEDGKATLVVTDPGWVTADGRSAEGGVSRVLLTPEKGTPQEGFEREDGDYWRTTVRLTGPGWKHLPTSVRLVFADGATILHEWDGRATWRMLELLRPAPLVEVLIDPESKNLIDLDPGNDGKRLEPADAQASTWAGFVTRAFSWLAMGVSWWL